MIVTRKRIDVRDSQTNRGFCFLHENTQSGQITIDVQSELPLPPDFQMNHPKLEEAEAHFLRLFPKEAGWMTFVYDIET